MTIRAVEKADAEEEGLEERVLSLHAVVLGHLVRAAELVRERVDTQDAIGERR